MKCPDCGAALAEVRIDSTHFVHRCGRCGGVLGDSETLNVVSAKHLAGWRRIGVDPSWFVGGGDKCPICSSRLRPYHNEEVPANLPVKRCARCGKWWFSGDGLFRYKEAQEVKINYYRLWYGTPLVPRLLLPIALVVLVIIAIGLGVKMVQMRQLVNVEANFGSRAFYATYLGQGEALVIFMATEIVNEIEYRQDGKEWTVVSVEYVDGVYRVVLSGLVEGGWVEVKVQDSIHEFMATM